MNKNAVIEKFYDFVSKALTKPSQRYSTRPTLTSKIKRLERKRSRGNIKRLRNDLREPE